MTELHRIAFVVNGQERELTIEPRRLLIDVLRQDLGLTGAHIGCEHGVCGTCTVLMNGETVRSCIMLGVQAAGAEITTIEGIAPSLEQLHPIQEAFWEKQGLQCGYCTPGMVLRTLELLRENPSPSRDEAREGIASNLCRCTGYQFIVDAVLDAAERLRAGATAETVEPDGRAGAGGGGEDARGGTAPVAGEGGLR